MITVLDGEKPEDIARAAAALQQGELVAFPTETVYGLGADALNADAVAKIFDAKGRPATNPLISHVASIDAARQLAAEWPEPAQKLADAFWPGPLTLIVPRGRDVPKIVTAELDSMGIRMPDHPVALALIEATGRPLAAPSANRYTHVSPTTAHHVIAGLGDHILFVLDGGPTRVGIESTVLSLLDEVPEILRPGAVTAGDIANVVGRVKVATHAVVGEKQSRPSPGLSRRHYSPAVPLILVADIEQAGPFGEKDVVIARDDVEAPNMVALGSSPTMWARELYALLHRYGPEDTERIIVERPPREADWLAILDRLERAASQ